MEPLAKADTTFDLSDIYPNLLGLSQIDGKGLYMVPSSFDVVTMYYNKDLFAKAGAPLPSDTWTWDDFTAACKTVLEKTKAYCFANGGNLPGSTGGPTSSRSCPATAARSSPKTARPCR